MKVIAKPSASSAVGWLEEAVALTVLAVSIAPVDGAKFLLWSSLQESVAVFPAGDFDVVDNCLSQRWVFSVNTRGFVYLAPDAWQAEGFWERYEDGDPNAEKIFLREMTGILAE